MATDDATEAALAAFFGDADLFDGKPDAIGNDHGAWAPSERDRVRAAALVSSASELGGDLDVLLAKMDTLRAAYEELREEAAAKLDTVDGMLGLAEALAQRSGQAERHEGDADRAAQRKRLKEHGIKKR